MCSITSQWGSGEEFRRPAPDIIESAWWLLEIAEFLLTSSKPQMHHVTSSRYATYPDFRSSNQWNGVELGKHVTWLSRHATHFKHFLLDVPQEWKEKEVEERGIVFWPRSCTVYHNPKVLTANDYTSYSQFLQIISWNQWFEEKS